MNRANAGPTGLEGCLRPIHLGYLVMFIACCLGGCTSSARFADGYAERRRAIQSVEIIPADVTIFALHSGGVQEARPDLTAEVRDYVAHAIGEVVQIHGLKPVRAAATASATSRTGESMLLADAIRESILIHQIGKGPRPKFDYSLGEGAGTLRGSNADALLLTSMVGLVPTGGRQALAAAALAVSVATRSFIRVETHRATVAMMLIEAKSGDVLWFGYATGPLDVESTASIRALVRAAGHSLEADIDE